MENGNEGKLMEQFSNLALKEAGDGYEGLIQIMKAVEAAETTIKQQMEENKQLRSELHNQTLNVVKFMRLNEPDTQSSLVRNDKDHINDIDSTPNFSNVLSRQQMVVDGVGPSQMSSPSTSFSPRSEHGKRVELNEHGIVQTCQQNNSNWDHDIMTNDKIEEEEIIQLKKHLAEFSRKEAQIIEEKLALEKRISSMRLAFDQQQQDLVDASAKALSYRQSIIEENVRLTFALEAAHQERSTFHSFLLPLLQEYTFQPPASDTQSIVCNVRILFKYLQEQLNRSEMKLKELKKQFAPWPLDANHFEHPSNMQSPSDYMPFAANKIGMELVPQSTYLPQIGQSKAYPQTTTDLEFRSDYNGPFPGASSNIFEANGERYSSHGSRVDSLQILPEQLLRQTTFDNDMESRNAEINDQLAVTSFSTTKTDPFTPFTPYLPPVLEEPSSSFSEAAVDDPLPGMKEFQIQGEAFPGRQLQACGYPINGTTGCIFEWVRHLEDGSVNYIEGAKESSYLVTADDVNSFLAIEVQPQDDRNRKGKLVKVFANEHRKITCDSEMQFNIEKMIRSGKASFSVSLPTRFLDIWEPATLVLKRQGYSIKCSGPSNVIVTDKFLPDKFLPSPTISISYDQPTEFYISTSDGSNHLLRVNTSTDTNNSRDLIVLTFRHFMVQANNKKKKMLNLFF